MRDPQRGIAAGLAVPVVLRGRGRDDLDYDQRCALDSTLGNLLRSLGHDEVRLDHVVRPEDHVDKREEDLASGSPLEVRLHLAEEALCGMLVARARSRRHVEGTLEKLVTLAVVRDRGIVRIVELRIQSRAHHASLRRVGIERKLRHVPDSTQPTQTCSRFLRITSGWRVGPLWARGPSRSVEVLDFTLAAVDTCAPQILASH